jgi:hypothetical protein
MLSDFQYERLRNLVAQSVKDSLLQNELSDHLCCSVEDKIGKGFDFEPALEIALAELCHGKLSEIESQTVFLLTLTNSYPMKKSIYLSGFLATVFILLGLVFRTMHWPESALILLFGNLALLFCMLLLLIKKRNISGFTLALKMYISILSGILIAVGSIFKIMHWPGANIQMIAGMFLLITIVVPAYFWKLYKDSLLTS